MRRKVVLVTGASDGIGLAAARELLRRKCHVILHGRDEGRVQAAKESLLAPSPGRPGQRPAAPGEVETCVADFASMDQVRALAEELRSRHGFLDVLLANAGTFENACVKTVDGFERTFAVNHLAHFLLTLSLLDPLKKAGMARIVVVSSVAHGNGTLDLEPVSPDRYDAFCAYANSKLANILFSLELARRLEGSGITVNAVHPGVVETKILLNNFGMRGVSPAAGADTPVFLCLAPSVHNITGQYWVRRHVAEPSPQARDPGACERLWSHSVLMLEPWLKGRRG